MTYTLSFQVEPVAKQRPRFGKGFSYTPKKTRDAERHLKLLMTTAWRREPLYGPLKVEIVFTITRPKSAKKRMYPTTKPGDLDNLIKLCADSGNGILWKDDSQIVEISARKEYGDPRIHLKVGELT